MVTVHHGGVGKNDLLVCTLGKNIVPGWPFELGRHGDEEVGGWMDGWEGRGRGWRRKERWRKERERRGGRE